MQSRARPDDREQERSQVKEREREPTGRVRIPKIQYRFLKELEETGVGGEARTSALAMADKIKRYPLEPQHVMGSWERFTKKAIDDFKANRGNNAEHDRQHVAYAVLFSSMRDAPPAQSIGDLKQRIDVFSAKHPPVSVDRSPSTAPREQPRQQSLLEREPPTIERQSETALTLLRSLSPQLRGSIEGSARELILEGHHTQRSARETLPDAVREFQADKNERNTVHTLTLAVIATAPDHRALLRDLWAMPREQMKEIEGEGRARLERYPPLETGLADLRKDAVDAAVRAAVDPSPQARREAIVLAQAREELECLADPKRLQWQNVADELARDLA